MVMKYNPATNRFEVQPAGIAGLDTPPAGTVEGQFYIDQKTGQYKQRSYDTGGRIPDTVVSSITVPPEKRNQPASYAPIVPVAGAKPTANWQPTAGQPVTKGQTVKTKGSQQTTTTTTVPKGTTTTIVPKSTTTTTVPTKNGQVDVTKLSPEQLNTIVTNAMNGIVTDPSSLGFTGLDVTPSGTTTTTGGSTKSSKPTAAQIASANQSSAKLLTQAGEQAQAAYNKIGEQQYSDITNRANDYYAGQKQTALGNIDAATADFLKNLIAPSAYGNAPVAQLTPEQQGLMQNLQAYGATGGLAADQMSHDVANNQFLADLMRSSNKGLQSAESDYFNSLKNAATGGQMAAKQGLERLITGMQGQTQATAEQVRRDYLLKGLDALITGQTNAANKLA